jgi:hypothetical protein
MVEEKHILNKTIEGDELNNGNGHGSCPNKNFFPFLPEIFGT